MEFDLSKENIQPLRGGRNVTQLEVALQAQSNQDYQRELILQKEAFENAIRSYDGEDHLDNWYQYICWVEQSYPKHGHEGNLVPLLEDCLSKFENDKRYAEDCRFCNLWIKYIDLQHNPLELYHMMHARGLCHGCSDLYRAWAYYHEAAGDFRSADMVFQLGRRALAQPYEELVRAHENMVYAAGQQLISGVDDERRLMEQRQALTSLRTYKSGKVGSIRTASTSGAVVLPASVPAPRSNITVPVYEDGIVAAPGAEAGPVSILAVARRQEAPKENTLKPGAWTTIPKRRHVSSVHRTPGFTVHEDIDLEQQGIRLPLDFFPVTHEDYSGWKPVLFYPDPEDPNVIRRCMYPKAKAYIDQPNTEYSIEEIKAHRYFNCLNVRRTETEQAIQSILVETSSSGHPYAQGAQQIFCQNNSSQVQVPTPQNVYHQLDPFVNQCHQKSMHESQFDPKLHVMFDESLNRFPHQSMSQGHGQSAADFHGPLFTTSEPNLQSQHAINAPEVSVVQEAHSQNRSGFYESPSHQTFGPAQRQSNEGLNLHEFKNDINDLWRSPSHNESMDSVMLAPKTNTTKFAIYEESSVGIPQQVQPKGSAMKSMPLKPLIDDDLAETGSRGGLDVAAADQPVDSAKRLNIFEDDSNSSFSDKPLPAVRFPEMGSPCNTQVFNFNLNAMKVSTPQSKQQAEAVSSEEAGKSTRKQLFGEERKLSVIFEETKSYGSSSSGSSTTLKSTLNHSKKENMAAISEEESRYHFNLAQNLKANAALRSSLLGDLMECDSGQSSPVAETPITPLMQAPSDPFSPILICTLLEHVGFPGRHSSGYVLLNTVPRVPVRKEAVVLGDDRYVIDKLLGKGTYGSVFKAQDFRRNSVVAVKHQKPPNRWEFYICCEIQARLAKHPLRDRFMDVYTGYFHDQASVLVSEFSPCGSLLDVSNAVKQKSGRSLKESLCIYFCVDMLSIISALHQAQIIHADVKPDNFLVQLAHDGTVKLQLIDFGCSIDMALFPPNTTFLRRVTTEDFVCCEMKDGRPWSYHTDLFCIAATAHVLLFDKYISLQSKDGCWSITHRFSRYMRVDLWNSFFGSLLNQQSGPADAEALQMQLKEALYSENYSSEMRYLVNILKNR